MAFLQPCSRFPNEDKYAKEKNDITIITLGNTHRPFEYGFLHEAITAITLGDEKCLKNFIADINDSSKIMWHIDALNNLINKKDNEELNKNGLTLESAAIFRDNLVGIRDGVESFSKKLDKIKEASERNMETSKLVSSEKVSGKIKRFPAKEKLEVFPKPENI